MRRALLASLVALALGCGDDETADATSTTTGSGTSASTSTGATAASTGSATTASSTTSAGGDGAGGSGPGGNGPGGQGDGGDGGYGGYGGSAGDQGGGGETSGNPLCPLAPLAPDEPVVVAPCEVLGVELSGALQLRPTPRGELLVRDASDDWVRLLPVGDGACPLAFDESFADEGRYPARHAQDGSGRFFRVAAFAKTVAVYISDADGHDEEMILCPSEEDVSLVRPHLGVTEDGSTIYVDDELGTDIVVTFEGGSCTSTAWTPPWTAQAELDGAGAPRGVHVAYGSLVHVAQGGLYIHGLDGSPIAAITDGVCSLRDASITPCQIDIADASCGVIHRFGLGGSLVAHVEPVDEAGDLLPLESRVSSFARTPAGSYAARAMVDGVVFSVDGM